MNESGNQKGNLSYLAGTKKRSDSLIQLIFHKRGARADEANEARALFLSNTAEERIEALGPLHRIALESFFSCRTADDLAIMSSPVETNTSSYRLVGSGMRT